MMAYTVPDGTLPVFDVAHSHRLRVFKDAKSVSTSGFHEIPLWNILDLLFPGAKELLICTARITALSDITLDWVGLKADIYDDDGTMVTQRWARHKNPALDDVVSLVSYPVVIAGLQSHWDVHFKTSSPGASPVCTVEVSAIWRLWTGLRPSVEEV